MMGEREGMSLEERRNAIAELINQKGSISFAQLKQAFPDVSEMTLRTDLKALDEAGRIIRVHGGAKSVDVVVGTDDLLGRRSERNPEAKHTIAMKAVKLIRPNTTFYLDSGSTTTEVAKCLPDMPCQIFTSGISCAIELARLEKPRVNLIGGTLNKYSMSLCGYKAIEDLSHVNLELVLLGTTSFCSGFGFSCGVEDEARLKSTLARNGEKVYVLMDSSKVGMKSTFSFAGLKDIDGIIADDKLPDELVKECQGLGIEII